MIVNGRSGVVTWTGAYWYLAHFSRYVRPGAVRIGVTGRLEGVRCLAFATPDGGLVAQLLNSRPQPERTAVEWKGRTVVVDLPARSLTTARWRD